MKRLVIGSYEEARQFALKRFSRLSPEQKLQWVSQMAAFVEEGRSQVRWRSLRKRGNVR